MRSLRLIVLALAASAVVGLAPSRATAQDQKPSGWQDSWYWGAYGGYANFPTAVQSVNAPAVGIDWVITRSRYALNVFAEQSFFNAVSTIPDFPTAAQRRVDIQDMRRFGFSALIFLPEIQRFKPYVGLGYSFNFIKQAVPEGQFFASPEARDTVMSRVNDARAQANLFGKIGVMYIWRRFAPFAEFSLMPTKGNSDWYVNGNGLTNIWSLGLRYNFGTSIDKSW